MGGRAGVSALTLRVSVRKVRTLDSTLCYARVGTAALRAARPARRPAATHARSRFCLVRAIPPAMGVAEEYLSRILRARVSDIALETPLEPIARLSARLDNTVLLKREGLQP